MSATNQPNTDDATGKAGWVTPEITTFLPAKAAEGISYRPTDGLSNLTP